MTAKEMEKTAILLGAARITVSRLRWYISDFGSSELKDIADNLEEAINEFSRTKKTTKRK